MGLAAELKKPYIAILIGGVTLACTAGLVLGSVIQLYSNRSVF